MEVSLRLFKASNNFNKAIIVNFSVSIIHSMFIDLGGRDDEADDEENTYETVAPDQQANYTTPSANYSDSYLVAKN